MFWNDYFESKILRGGLIREACHSLLTDKVILMLICLQMPSKKVFCGSLRSYVRELSRNIRSADSRRGPNNDVIV